MAVMIWQGMYGNGVSIGLIKIAPNELAVEEVGQTVLTNARLRSETPGNRVHEE